MACNCEICQEIREFDVRVARIPDPEDREFFEKLFSRYMDASYDADMYKYLLKQVKEKKND